MIKKHRLSALLLALALIGILPAAASTPAPTFSGQQNGNSATFTLGNESGNIYAAQVELTLTGSYQSASFQPGQKDAYSTCKVTTSNGTTQVTIYVTSSNPLNKGNTLGTLTMDKSFSLPSTAKLTLLGHGSDQIPWEGSNQGTGSVSLSTGSGGSGGNSGGSGGDGRNERYEVQVEECHHGTVTASKQRAEQGSSVTLTVQPDSGYKLDTLTVTNRSGRTVKLNQSGGRYTFTMPGSNVTVSASFAATGAVEPTPTPKPLPFTDVKENQWYTDAVRYVYEQGMMNGTGENRFSPEETTTRGMIVTMLHRMEDAPAAQPASFPDVQENQWYTAGVAWAAQEGIVTGYDDGNFGPDNAITREQMAAILYRYAQKKGYSTANSDPLTAFTDAGTVSEYAVQAMQWAVGSGLITGKGEGILDPGGSATRAQVAAILMRFCQNMIPV